MRHGVIRLGSRGQPSRVKHHAKDDSALQHADQPEPDEPEYANSEALHGCLSRVPSQGKCPPEHPHEPAVTGARPGGRITSRAAEGYLFAVTRQPGCMILLLSLAAVAWQPMHSQVAAPPRDSTSAIIVGREQTAQVRIIYGLPVRTRREVLGGIIPYNTPWLPGADGPTILNTTVALQVGTLRVPGGEYSLWTLPTAGGTTLIFNRGTTTTYDSAADVGRVRLATDTLATPIDRFLIRLQAVRKGPDTTGVHLRHTNAGYPMDHEVLTVGSGVSTSLIIMWDRFRWSVPVTAADTLRAGH